jgi:DNA-binding XRE family transcriptional regulator
MTKKMEAKAMAKAKATKWTNLKEELRASGDYDENVVQGHMEHLHSEVRTYRLAEIRENLGITQQILAEHIGISQARVSQIEHGELEHTELATLRSYFRELGAEVEVVVRIGNERVQIA